MATKNELKANKHENYVTYSLIAFIVPIVGIFIGVMYLGKDKPLDKKLGEHLIALSILFAILEGFFLIMLWDSLFPSTYYVPINY